VEEEYCKLDPKFEEFYLYEVTLCESEPEEGMTLSEQREWDEHVEAIWEEEWSNVKLFLEEHRKHPWLSLPFTPQEYNDELDHIKNLAFFMESALEAFLEDLVLQDRRERGPCIDDYATDGWHVSTPLDNNPFHTIQDSPENKEQNPPTISFYWNGSFWLIGNPGREQPVPDSIGIKRIQYVMMNSKGKDLKVSKLPSSKEEEKTERSSAVRTCSEALKKILGTDGLGFLNEYLNDGTLHIGTTCWYRPAGEKPVNWNFDPPK
jgi:hypothetical protein